MAAGDRRHDAVRHHLSRIHASPGFARNDRMFRFLRFLVERWLDGQTDVLKETVIGVDVFGRRPDYDPRLDSIVRTEAARLRNRLHEYYSGEGATDPVHIEIPKGTYVPVVEFRGIRPARRLRVLVASAAVLIVGPLVLAAWTLHRHPQSPIRIAVLPLENRSASPSDDCFADALTDEIIRNLSVIDGLEVRSRTSSFVFKGQPRNIRDTARQLNVDVLLEGSVLRDGDQLRIDMQLVRGADDSAIWAGRFDRRAQDIFAIQDEISLGIVNNLRLRLGGGRRRYETSVQAYNQYLRANVLALPAVVRNEPPRPEDLPRVRYANSIRAFKAAIDADGSFAPAYAGLAYVYAIRSVQFPLDHPADELANMRAAAERAVSLDPLLPEAHHALAMVAARDGRWDDAERSFRRAIALDPNSSTSHSDYAYWLLAVLGRHGEALEQLRQAAAADPLSKDVRSTTALVLVAAGRYAEAARYCDPADRVCLSRISSAEGRFDETIRLLADHPELVHNPQTRGFLAFAYARTGRRDEAAQDAAASPYPNEQALVFAKLGDIDQTVNALTQMAAVGPQRLGLYLDYPEFARVRNDSRLQALRAQLGLPAATLGRR